MAIVSLTFVFWVFCFVFFLMSSHSQKINKNPKAIFFPSDLEKLHIHWPKPDKGGFFLFVFVFHFFSFFFVFVFYIIKRKKKTLLQSSFTNIITDSLGVMEQVSHESLLPWVKSPPEKEASKSAEVGGAICLLQSATCVLYDTAGQRECSVSERWLNQSSHGGTLQVGTSLCVSF